MTPPVTPAPPTTSELVEWCEQMAEAHETQAIERGKAVDEIGALLGIGYSIQARMLRAIAARLKQEGT